MANLQNWIDQARKHWKEHRPNLYREAVASGKLEPMLRDAAERTDAEMAQLIANGLTEREAWEVVRESYLFPPQEGSARASDSPLYRPSEPMSPTDVLHAAIKSGARTVEMPEPLTASEFAHELKKAARGEYD